jgi:hypothetical protein
LSLTDNVISPVKAQPGRNPDAGFGRDFPNNGVTFSAGGAYNTVKLPKTVCSSAVAVAKSPSKHKDWALFRVSAGMNESLRIT